MVKKIVKELYFILLLGVFTAVVYNFLLNIPVLSTVGDAQRFNGYQAYFLRHSVSQFGQLGLWDPLLGSGMSWISHPGGALFSPAAWIVPLLTTDTTLGSMMLFYIYAFSASFSYFFLCRVLGLSRFTSFFVGILAICNQYIFTFVANGWFEEFIGFTILPLTTAFLWMALNRKSYSYAIVGGLALSLNFFVNSFYVFHYNVIVLVILSIAFITREHIRLKKEKLKRYFDLFKLFKINITFWATGIGVSAIKIIPLLEFRALSARNSVPLSTVELPGNVMTFDFFNALIRQFIVPPGFTNKFSLYSNNLAFLAIVIAFIYCFYKRSFKHAVFLTILITGIWGYFANRVPVDFYALVYYLLPGFNSNIFPLRFITIISFAFLMCVGLGIEVLVSNKNKMISLLGLVIGFAIIGGSSIYVFQSYRNVTYPQILNVKKEIKKNQIKIEKPKSYDQAPQIKTSKNPSLLSVLSALTREYKPEGRVYSSFISPDLEFLANQIILEQKIPVVHPSYEPIIPTYQYPVTYKDKIINDLDHLKKRYKIWSVLNVRFQLQKKEKFEHNGCRGLTIDFFVDAIPSPSACNFVGSRLTKIYETKSGGIFYDSDVLPKFSLIPKAALVMSDNRFNDFSAIITKMILFHPEFDLSKMTVLTSGRKFIDEYSEDELSKFYVIILADEKYKSEKKGNTLMKNYIKNGGKIIRLNSIWRNYENLHERSLSIFTKNPAWNYSKEDEKKLSSLFKNINSDAKGAVEIKKISPEDIELIIYSNKENQVLQFSDMYFPGWKTSINGRDTIVYMADGLVKGVVVPKGKSRVRFYYDPISLKIGTLISASSILGIVFYILYKRRKK